MWAGLAERMEEQVWWGDGVTSVIGSLDFLFPGLSEDAQRPEKRPTWGN